MARKQLSLFGKSETWPEGFRYQPNVVPPDEEEALLQQVRGLPFKEFEFQGFVGKRRSFWVGPNLKVGKPPTLDAHVLRHDC